CGPLRAPLREPCMGRSGACAGTCAGTGSHRAGATPRACRAFPAARDRVAAHAPPSVSIRTRSLPDLVRPLQVALDEWIQVAVHDGLHVAVFDAGAMVLDERVRHEGVRANLAAEADLLLFRLAFGALGVLDFFVVL